MTEYTQAGRPMRVDTDLGEDVLLLEGFSGREGISRPFTWELELLSEEPGIDPDDVLRTAMLVTIETPSGEDRLVHGKVRRFVQVGRSEELTSYRAEIVPWPWFLSLTRDCRIFQEMTVLQIVEDVFESQGFSDYDIRCTRNYPEREYCVQYRETHLDFVSRLLEEEGIFYFFEHETSKHTLVLTDDNSAVEPCPGLPEARMSTPRVPEEDVVTDLVREHDVHAGEITLTDYDYLQPSLSLESSISGEGAGEVYDYHPGRYTSREEGERRARLLMELREAGRHVARGESSCRAFRSGFRFELAGHFDSAANQPWTLVELHHTGRAGDYRSWESASLDYENEFVAIPHEVPYRPPRKTPRPVVEGTQTAVVVGKSGEEIWTDEHGRIKVQFHWDREGKRDENSSCWVRVSTPWAGKGWGELHVPRIGQEVVVDFLEGDPDRPLVVGSVYNANYAPPYDTSGAGSTKSGMKSRSSKGGGGYNEISIDDAKGEEKITVHAQKDMSGTVKNDETWSVGHDRTINVDNVLEETAQKEVRVESATSSIEIEAATEIKLTVGQSSLTMSQDGTIELSGVDVTVKGEGVGVTVEGTPLVKLDGISVASEADVDNRMEGTIVSVEATATNTVKGNLVNVQGSTLTAQSSGPATVKGSPLLLNM
jgi:type VI secretion system secreted protein VgrG